MICSCRRALCPPFIRRHRTPLGQQQWPAGPADGGVPAAPAVPCAGPGWDVLPSHHGSRQLRDHGHVDGDVVALAHALALHVVCNLQVRMGAVGSTGAERCGVVAAGEAGRQKREPKAGTRGPAWAVKGTGTTADKQMSDGASATKRSCRCKAASVDPRPCPLLRP